MTGARALELDLFPGAWAVCRLPADAAVPAWAAGPFASVTRTPDELSVVCPAVGVPADATASRGWRLLRLRGPLPLDAVGVLLAVLAPLAAAGVSVLPVGTHDTDWLLLPAGRLDAALAALAAAGHRVHDERPVVVRPLAERPAYVPTVAAWLLAEWGALWPGATPDSVAADVADYVRHDELPLALVAEAGDGETARCVGTASLRAHTDGFPAALTPWLVRVYVAPDRRGDSVGRRLVQAAEAAARRLGAPELWLCTADRQRFYAALGWEEREAAEYRGQRVTVMRRGLAG